MKLKIFFIPIVLLLTFFFSALPIPAQDNIPRNISLAIEKGDAESLAGYFNSTVELVIIDNEDAYSKAHAKTMVSNFFSSHRPSGFQVLHKGGSDGSYYVIGNLSTGNGSFRVYYLLKDVGSQPFIHQLRFESEN